MALDERMADFIGRIYETAGTEDGWETISRGIMEFTGSSFTLITLLDAHSCNSDLCSAYGRDDSSFAIGVDEFPNRFVDDPSVAFARENPLARVCDSRQFAPQGTDFFRWYRDRFDCDQWIVGYTPQRDGLTFGLSIHLPSAHASSGTAAQVFPLLFEHVVRAAHLAARAGTASETRAIIVLDHAGRVVESSPAADAILRLGRFVTNRGGWLATAEPGQQPELDRLIASALGATKDGTLGASLLLQDKRGSASGIAKVSPWPRIRALSGLIAPQVRVELVDLNGTQTGFEATDFPWPLTRREKQVAALLLEGHSLHSLAACLSISYNTARIHLKTLFEKTGTNRQTALVRLLSRLAA